MPNRELPKSVGDNDGFVRLIQVACDDEVVGARLESILSMPGDRRKLFLHGLINDLSTAQAPAPLLEALACLVDDAVAERAFVVVSEQRRGPQHFAQPPVPAFLSERSMPITDCLSEEFASLADDELLGRLRSGTLTKAATEVARRELAARGIDIESALAQHTQATPPPPHISALVPHRFAGLLVRILRFPLRAVLGMEPPWAVIVFGGALFYLLFALIRYGFVQLINIHPIPAYGRPLAYTGIAVIALGMFWLALAIWRSAGRVQSAFWQIVIRVFAVLFAANAVLGTQNLIDLVPKYLGSPARESIMDAIPKR